MKGYKNYLVLLLFLLISLQAIADPLVEPNISVTPKELKWSNYFVGDMILKQIKIENTGRGQLNITRIDLTGDVTEFSNRSGWETQTVESNGFVYLKIFFNPTSAGTKTATVRVYSNDPDENLVLINCTGVALLYPKLSVSPTTLDFGIANNKLTFLISNAGEGDLVWEVAEKPDKPWISSITPESGLNNSTITVVVDRDQLTNTSDTGIIMVSTWSEVQNITVNIAKLEQTGVNIYEQENPNEYQLLKNYPNPFNPITTICYDLPRNSVVILAVYDLLGRRIVELVNQHQTAGKHEIKFNPQNLSTGVYIYQLTADKFVDRKKMMYLK
jgi:hypothetical protein